MYIKFITILGINVQYLCALVTDQVDVVVRCTLTEMR
jgi:hypothetical protein